MVVVNVRSWLLLFFFYQGGVSGLDMYIFDRSS